MTSRDRGLRGKQLQVLPGFEPQALEHLRDGAFDAARLTQARLLKGLSKQQLALELSVSAAAVGQWEAEIQIPKAHHLQQLSQVLGVPVAYFYLGRPYARMDASSAHFRSLRRTKVSQRAKAIAYVEQLWELAYALEKRIEFPSVDLPGLNGGDHVPGVVPRNPTAAAHFLRQAWCLPDGPVTHLVNKLELHGVVVSHVRFADNDTETATIDAFSTSHLPRPLVITTPDRANDVYRHRFTLAHELGHLLLHHDVAPGDLQQEREANEFASELLTPLAQVADDLPARLHISHLEGVSRKWGVSIKSIIKRTRETGQASEISARRAYQRYEQLRTAGVIRPEPITLYPGEVPTLLRRAYETAEQHDMLTVATLAEELVWNIDRLRLLLGLDHQRPRLSLVAD